MPAFEETCLGSRIRLYGNVAGRSRGFASKGTGARPSVPRSSWLLKEYGIWQHSGPGLELGGPMVSPIPEAVWFRLNGHVGLLSRELAAVEAGSDAGDAH